MHDMAMGGGIYGDPSASPSLLGAMVGPSEAEQVAMLASHYVELDAKAREALTALPLQQAMQVLSDYENRKATIRNP
eukprot:CAMPEP_0172903342 /NCGR_PEP_ID=MMETSP1075-20121228/170346_1 /TAXON_ID=2916 /ORGANISM="Ceratium fusus, Strain PA161109" /LENGTH=76 /DNA_ID=CAMNT_0013760123 /DNA_START=1 /DNA_END=227 /DNA_ORIENTATION=+